MLELPSSVCQKSILVLGVRRDHHVVGKDVRQWDQHADPGIADVDGMPGYAQALPAQLPPRGQLFPAQAQHQTRALRQFNHACRAWALPAIDRGGAMDEMQAGHRVVLEPGQRCGDGPRQSPAMIGWQPAPAESIDQVDHLIVHQQWCSDGLLLTVHGSVRGRSVQRRCRRYYRAKAGTEINLLLPVFH